MKTPSTSPLADDETASTLSTDLSKCNPGASGRISSGFSSDFKAAGIFSEVALLMPNIAPSKYSECDTITGTYQFILPYKESINGLLPGVTRGYTAGIQAGNVDGALWNLAVAILYQYQLGKPLLGLNDTCRSAVSQMSNLQKKDSEGVARMLWQMALNLTSKSDETKELKGEVFGYEVYIKDSRGWRSATGCVPCGASCNLWRR